MFQYLNMLKGTICISTWMCSRELYVSVFECTQGNYMYQYLNVFKGTMFQYLNVLKGTICFSIWMFSRELCFSIWMCSRKLYVSVFECTQGNYMYQYLNVLLLLYHSPSIHIILSQLDFSKIIYDSLTNDIYWTILK
jgi:hypothetical protein